MAAGLSRSTVSMNVCKADILLVFISQLYGVEVVEVVPLFLWPISGAAFVIDKVTWVYYILRTTARSPIFQ